MANSAVPFGEDEIYVTISIGVAEGSGAETIAELVKGADGARCAAKSGGRDRVASAGSADRRIGDLAAE